MSVQSAGILVFHRQGGKVEVLLAHPGGPFWAKKDKWTVPKGELEPDEDLLTGAAREFEEEVGVKPPTGERLELGEFKQGSAKVNHIWAIEGDVDLRAFKSNTFSMEWPPKSGVQQEFAENDRAAWFDLATARRKLFTAQGVFIDRLAELLDVTLTTDPEQLSLL